MQIDRCACFQIPFAALKETAQAHGCATVEDLQEHTAFGHRCRLCHPYVRRMLRTGEVVFREIVTARDEPAPVSSA